MVGIMEKTNKTNTKAQAVDNKKAEVATVEKAKAEVVQYEVTAMAGKERNLVFYDTNLITHTQAIEHYRDAGNLAILAIAAELDAMDRDKSYAKGGFKSVAEYAQVVFEYKPATVSLYLRSARAFLEKTDNPEEPIAYKGGLPHLTVGQMIELLPLVKDENDISEVVSAFRNSTINNRMSTKDLRKEVSAIRGIETRKTSDKAEKTPMQKADKLGEYNKDKLPKGMDSKGYALTQIEAAMSAFDNYAIAMADVEHDGTVDNKITEVVTKLQELRAVIG